jgi:hypothetical protein
MYGALIGGDVAAGKDGDALRRASDHALGPNRTER